MTYLVKFTSQFKKDFEAGKETALSLFYLRDIV